MSSDARPTLSGMYELIHRGIFRSSTITIYVFLRLHLGEILKYEDIAAYTGLHANTIYAETTALEAANLVKKIKVKKSFRYTTRNMPTGLIKDLLTPTPTTSSSSSSSRISRLSRVIGPIIASSPIKNLKYNYSRGRREATFVNDKDWISAKAILAKYFPESFLDPLRLGEKRFMKLCALLLDDDFDLDEYTKWFKDEKYVRLHFNWNIFLLSSMIDEYRAVATEVAESEEHLHTSSEKMKTKHSKGAARDKAWIRKNIKSKVKKNGAKTRSKKPPARDS